MTKTADILTDEELTRWLATEIMKWQPTTENSLWRCDGAGSVNLLDVWRPLDLLDDCRKVEDRMEELGLKSAYVRALMIVVGAVSGPPQSSGVDSLMLDADALVFASARQKCDAIRMAWTDHKRQAAKQ